jgi:hypothetical protein
MHFDWDKFWERLGFGKKKDTRELYKVEVTIQIPKNDGSGLYLSSGKFIINQFANNPIDAGKFAAMFVEESVKAALVSVKPANFTGTAEQSGPADSPGKKYTVTENGVERPMTEAEQEAVDKIFGMGNELFNEADKFFEKAGKIFGDMNQVFKKYK